MTGDNVENISTLHVADGDGWTPWRPNVLPEQADDRTLLGVDSEGTVHLLQWVDNRPGMDPVWCALAWDVRGRLKVPVVHALREENSDLIVAWRFA